MRVSLIQNRVNQWASVRVLAFWVMALSTFTPPQVYAEGADPEENCFSTAPDIGEKLNCIPGVISWHELSEPKPDPGMRMFEIQFLQPVDHLAKTGGNFAQKLILHHRSVEEPMVLQTSGYNIYAVRMSALARRFGTNQIQVEHRFFAESKPTPVLWSFLNVEQSAHDFHAIAQAFQRLYSKPWVGTGASKGGMTSVYHRRFFPGDLAGTVADVAPLSFSDNDERYNEFLRNVGGDEWRECREKLKTFQQELLGHRDEFTPEEKDRFTQLGSSDVAFEHAVIEFGFYFWQYGNPRDEKKGCDQIPLGKPFAEQLAFFNQWGGVSEYSDENLSQFIPYYYQAANELGAPANLMDHLEQFRRYDFTLGQYLPRGEEAHYSPTLMRDVENWVKTEGNEIAFVYGDYDPWTAGAFPVSESGKNVFRFNVPAGNHGAKFNLLPEPEQKRALELFSRWFGKAPMEVEKSVFSRDEGEFGPALDDLEFEWRKKHRL